MDEIVEKSVGESNSFSLFLSLSFLADFSSYLSLSLFLSWLFTDWRGWMVRILDGRVISYIGLCSRIGVTRMAIRNYGSFYRAGLEIGQACN